ncbi:MAG: flagellin lysine-N-methylase [Clostridium sp.]
MKIRKPSYFNSFKCIASECEDTCCAGWGIVIDEETLKKYEKVEGDFRERLNEEIISDDEDKIFKLKGDRCSFLNDKNLCDIYKELGEEGLCYTCREYPRYREEFLHIKEIGISLSCPEAARIILRDEEEGVFIEIDNDEKWEEDDEIEEEMLSHFLESREIIYDILKDRSLEISERCALCLKFVEELQDKVYFNEIEEIEEILKNYKNSSFKEEIIKEIKEYKGDEKYKNIHQYIKIFEDLRHIHPNDPLALQDILRTFFQTPEDEEIYLKKHREFDEYFKKNEYKYENILIYFVFRYYMKGIFDYD